MFKKKNKIKNSNQSIIDTENLIIGSTFSGKMPMIINGLDLYYLILLLQGKQITIIELGNKTLYEGNASDCNYERVEYEVIKFEKIHYDNSYTITVRTIFMDTDKIRIPEFKDKKGKCLNCGKLTYFYDEGYFCTNKCREEYKNKEN